MSRILALDVGKKRIGIAISDPLNMFSRGLPTIQRLPEDKAIEEIVNISHDNNVIKIIAGLPLNMNGTSGEQAEDVTEFMEKIKAKTDIEILFLDERLTSKLAKQILIAQNVSPSRNKGLVDKKAAEIILQNYLDSPHG